MTLTKKHFIAIANILKDCRQIDNKEKQEFLILAFCNYFKSENPNFKENRFINAVRGQEK